jgi:beta-lactamase regulating signal transducer with metallopeptidase domain
VTSVDSLEPFSFVHGTLVPRVAISQGLLDRLSEDELRAALEHESYHVRNLDPLRALVGEVLSDALFLLPALQVLRERYELARELAADRHAAEVCGSRPLAGALLKALEGPGWREPAVSASLGGSQLMTSRLSQLETGRAPQLATADLASFICSMLGGGAFMVLYAAALVGLGGVTGLDHAIANELSPARLLGGAVLCVIPILVVVTGVYWRLTSRAGRPL